MPTRDRRLRERLAARLASAPDTAHVLAAADEVVRSVVPAQGAAWGTVDPASGLSTSCHVFGLLADVPDVVASPAGVPGGGARRERRLFELDWAGDGPSTFAQLTREGRAAAALRLEVGDPRGVRRYDELLAPVGVHDELRLSLVIDAEPWASGILYRWSGDPGPGPFTPDEVALAAAAAPQVASAVRDGLLRAVCDHPAVDVPPGSLVLDPGGRITLSSPAAQALLAGLDADGQLGAALSSVQAGTRARGRASVTVAAPGGLRTLHGSPATPGEGKHGEGDVVVVVEQPRPAALAPLLMRALGLTPREREIAQHLLIGRPRGQIARQLGLSDHTLGDHVRSLYRKAGVAGRAELAALLFDGYYARPRSERAAPNPYGWFALAEYRPA